MADRPRHGRDYRKRTPADRNFVNAPGADTAFVSIIQVNQIDANTLIWDLDCPSTAVNTGDNLRALTIGDFDPLDPVDASAAPTAIIDLSANAAPGTTRIQATYDVGTIAPTTVMAILANTGNAAADTQFNARVINPNPAISIISEP